MRVLARQKRLIAVCLVLGLSNGCATADQQDSQGAVDYRQYCGQCHGFDARGAGPRAVGLEPPPPDLSLIARRNNGRFPQETLATYIDGRADLLENGSRAMPAWGRHFSAEFGDGVVSEELAKGKLLGIVDYLRGIQR